MSDLIWFQTALELIQSTKWVTRVYTPGIPGWAHWLPNETMPICTQRLFWLTNRGPPESPCCHVSDRYDADCGLRMVADSPDNCLYRHLGIRRRESAAWWAAGICDRSRGFSKSANWLHEAVANLGHLHDFVKIIFYRFKKKKKKLFIIHFFLKRLVIFFYRFFFK